MSSIRAEAAEELLLLGITNELLFFSAPVALPPLGRLGLLDPAPPAGGMGESRDVRNELKPCPPDERTW